MTITGGKINSIGTFHDGRKAPIYFNVKMSMTTGDLKIFCDCDKISKSVTVYLASGEEFVNASEREYIEICIKQDGSYTFIPYSGQNNQADDPLELERDITISNKDGRWQAVTFIPFFYLPTPGETPDNELCMMWMLNVIASSSKTDEVLSIAKLPAKKEANRLIPTPWTTLLS